MDYITLKDWAARLGVMHQTARAWANRGKLPAARKMGRDWFIPPETPRPKDRRYVENPIRNRRKNEPTK
jgi:predicted site-specific integrase-resolvase